MQLLSDGVGINLTGAHHLRFDLVDKLEKVYRYSTLDTPPSRVIINDALTGLVTFSPPDEALFKYQRSPYKCYFWVYPTETTRYSVPEDETFNCMIRVIREY
jgi:hypothetical protein